MPDIINIIDSRIIPDQEKSTDRFGLQPTFQQPYVVIEVHEPIVGGDDGSKGVSGDLASRRFGQVFEQAGNIFDESVGIAGDVIANITGDEQQGPPNPNPARERLSVKSDIAISVALPMPLELPYQDSANWSDDNTALTDLALAGAAQIPKVLGGSGSKSIVGGLLDAVSAQSAISAARKVGQRSLGIAIQPRKEMYYDGPVFREFTFSWDLSPKNQSESEKIQKMVNVIRLHSYPDRLGGENGTFGFEVWKLPSTYKIKFKLGGSDNTKIPKIKPCVATSINFNPNKEGQWKSFEDGSPMSMNLSITFKEIEVITQKDVKEGF